MHLFTKSGNHWTEYYYVEFPDADGSDAYGFDVDVEGSNVLVSRTAVLCKMERSTSSRTM